MAPQSQVQQPLSIMPVTLPGSMEIITALELASTKFSLAVSSLPWVVFKNRVLSPDHMMLNVDIQLLAAWESTLPYALSPLMGRESSSYLPVPHFDAYYFLAEAIRLLSNTHTWDMVPNDQLLSILEILLKRIPNRILAGLFEINIPTVRAAWESLVYYTGSRGYRDSFNFLIGVGLKHERWVVPRGASYLGLAAAMGSIGVVRSLLKAGARADGNIGRDEESPLVEVTATGNLDCVKLLLERCDVNRRVNPFGETTFELFLRCVSKGLFVVHPKEDHAYLPDSFQLTGTEAQWLKVDFSLSNTYCASALGMMLDAGANVDSVRSYLMMDGLNARLFYAEKRIPMEWHPTVLEWVYYRGTNDVFYKLLPYSTRRVTWATRLAIWLSADQGREALHEYLLSQLSHPSFNTMGFLEFVLAEQFLEKAKGIDRIVIEGLIEVGVDLKRASSPKGVNFFLRCLVKWAPRLDKEDFVAVLRLLLQFDAVINEEVLEASINREGIEILLVLSEHGADTGYYGAGALSIAASYDNYDAVNWLLGNGVNINGVVHKPSYQGSRLWSPIALATVRRPFKREWLDNSIKPASLEMIDHLISHGAKLKKSPEDTTPFFFLQHFLENADSDVVDVVDKLKLFLDLEPDNGDLIGDGCLLEACFRSYSSIQSMQHRLAMFELLIERGIPAVSCRLLPALIIGGVCNETVQKLMRDGADINVYFLDGEYQRSYTAVQAAACRGNNELVAELVSMGADLNKPAVGWGGRTALQDACELESTTTAGKSRKMELIHFLIQNGAEINAPAASYWGCTALQLAARVGDIETALLLLYHGADVNSLRLGHDGGRCALDDAACSARLDMVQLLLNVGALSGVRGQNGYQGAIERAERNRHYTIADLIRKHARKEEEHVQSDPWDDI
ncbi:ankyrin [Hypoxylon sp. FL1284]|nr:ankyrin [Hypoxylon sp. FL1284]